MRKSRSKTDIDQVDGLEIFRRRRHRSDTPDGNTSQASSEISNNGRKRNGSGPFSWQRNSGKHSGVSFFNDFDVRKVLDLPFSSILDKCSMLQQMIWP